MLLPQKPLIGGTFLFALLLLSCSKDDNFEKQQLPCNDNQVHVVFEKDITFENMLYETLNKYLLSINQSELTSSPEANQVAFDHTKHMIETNSLHHQNFSNRQSYFYSLGFNGVRENVAKGIDNANDLINAWLQSPPHRAAIESTNTHTGICVLKNEDGIYFITQIYLK